MRLTRATQTGLLVLGLIGLRGTQLGIASPLLARKASQAPRFEYAGGTGNLPAGCQGELQLTHRSIVFNCPDGSIAMPIDSIVDMEYRPSVSRTIKHMNLRWKTKPSGSGGKANRFFTVVYREHNAMQAVVLKVAPMDMRPYLAEIELTSGQRIHVSDYRRFE